VILDKGLYEFKTKDPRSMVRGAIERRCEGVSRQNAVSQKYFTKLSDGRYEPGVH
jgi:hypothetical protein